MVNGAPLGVLHLCAGNLYGGVERIVGECARSRARCPAMQPAFAVCFEGRLSAELRAEGVACAPLGGVRISRPPTVWRARRTLAALLSATRPDVVVCHSTWMHGVAAPAVRRTDAHLVLWLHDCASGRPWPERWARMTAPDLVVANSRYTAATVSHLYSDPPPVQVVYAPVASGAAQPSEQRAALRSSLGAGERDVVVVIASRLEEWKGHMPLIDAALAVQGPWRIWIAGAAQRPHERDYAHRLQARADAAGAGDRIRFLGERADVPALMRAADIHCQPNTAPEPFGLAFVEALYAGVPVVTTAFGGACEIVTAECGELVPAGDSPALAAALQRLVSDAGLRRRLGAAGPGRATELCDPARQLHALAAALRPVAALA